MGNVPDVAVARDAVATLHGLLRDVWAGAELPGAPADWARLVAAVIQLADDTRDCRGLALAIARRDNAVPWNLLVAESGRPRSTLENRHLSFLARGGSRP